MLSRFLAERVHMAIVQDEYGGMAGVVTIDNVEFRIEQATRRKIERVRVTVIDDVDEK